MGSKLFGGGRHGRPVRRGSPVATDGGQRMRAHRHDVGQSRWPRQILLGLCVLGLLGVTQLIPVMGRSPESSQFAADLTQESQESQESPVPTVKSTSSPAIPGRSAQASSSSTGRAVTAPPNSTKLPGATEKKSQRDAQSPHTEPPSSAPKRTPAPRKPSPLRNGGGSAGPELGVQFHGLWKQATPDRRAKVLDTLSGAGADWVRIDMSWAMLQPKGPGEFDTGWGVPHIDRVLAEANQRGLKVMVTLWQTPDWANGGKGLRAAPGDSSDFARAARFAADRWGNSVDAWEIWNEPNSGDFLVGADPKTYVNLLCAAYPAIKGEDASPVVFGGLMYNDDKWLARAYSVGAQGCFDVVGTHPYIGPSNAPPDSPDNGSVWRMTHVSAVRKVMVDRGDGNKPIWFTEFGWSTGEAKGAANWDQGVSENQQASFLRDAVQLVRDRYPYVGVMFWFRDHEQTTGDAHEDGYGLMRANLEAKPALQAFKDVAN